MFRAPIIVAIVIAMAGFAAPQAAHAQSDPTYYSSYWGVRLDGRQCVPTCRELAVIAIGKQLPFLGTNGTASQMWNAVGSNWKKVSNTGTNLPTWFSVVCWNGSVANGAGHVALCVGVKDRATRTIWVLDSNWFTLNGSPRGALHSVRLDNRVTGWLE